MDGFADVMDYELFSIPPDRVLHVAVFCENSTQANQLIATRQGEAERRGEHIVIVNDPITVCRQQIAGGKDQKSPTNTELRPYSSPNEECLNRICHHAWQAISAGKKALTILVNYTKKGSKKTQPNFVAQISQCEKLVDRFLPDWSFGFPLTRFCFYLLSDFSTDNLKELILSHRQIVFPETIDTWEHSLTEEIMGRPSRSIGIQSSLPGTLQTHVAMTALGAPRTHFKFKLPTGEVRTIARNLREFVEILPALTQETFNFHLLRWANNTLNGEPLSKAVLRSDFALWTAYGLHDCSLAMEIFELAYGRTHGQDLSELSAFGQQMLKQAVTKTCANRLTFLESYLTRVLGAPSKRKTSAVLRAYLLVNSHEINISKLTSDIETITGVDSVFGLAEGPYEFLIKLAETTLDTLRAAIGAIKDIPGVTSTLTLPEDEKLFLV